MKKENKARFFAVKKYFSAHSKDIKDFICIIVAFSIAFAIITSLVPLSTTNDMTACKEELASYLASSSRYAVNTDIYTLKISNEGTTLSINDSIASCTAVFDDTTNTYNYTSNCYVLLTAIFWFVFTLPVGIFLFFALQGVLSIIKDLCKWISKLRHEYKLNKAEVELNLSREEAEEYELSIQRKEEFDRAYQKGYDSGYTDGRSKGFKQGQNDAYEEGYVKGYADGQEEVSEAINSFMNDENESIDDDYADEDPFED